MQWFVETVLGRVSIRHMLLYIYTCLSVCAVVIAGRLLYATQWKWILQPPPSPPPRLSHDRRPSVYATDYVRCTTTSRRNFTKVTACDRGLSGVFGVRENTFKQQFRRYIGRPFRVVFFRCRKTCHWLCFFFRRSH